MSEKPQSSKTTHVESTGDLSRSIKSMLLVKKILTPTSRSKAMAASLESVDQYSHTSAGFEERIGQGSFWAEGLYKARAAREIAKFDKNFYGEK